MLVVGICLKVVVEWLCMRNMHTNLVEWALNKIIYI